MDISEGWSLADSRDGCKSLQPVVIMALFIGKEEVIPFVGLHSEREAPSDWAFIRRMIGDACDRIDRDVVYNLGGLPLKAVIKIHSDEIEYKVSLYVVDSLSVLQFVEVAFD